MRMGSAGEWDITFLRNDRRNCEYSWPSNREEFLKRKAKSLGILLNGVLKEFVNLHTVSFIRLL